MSDPLERLRCINPVDPEVLRRAGTPPVPDDVLREVRAPAPLSRRRRWRPAALLVAGVLLTGSAAAAVTLKPGRTSDPLHGTVTGPILGAPAGRATYRVEMAPYLSAGRVGWCVTLAVRAGARLGIGGEGCGAAPPAGAPQIAGGGVSSTVSGDSTLAYFVVDERVARIVMPDGQRVIPRVSPGVPSPWRAAVVETDGEPAPEAVSFVDSAGRVLSVAGQRRAGTRAAGTARLATQQYHPTTGTASGCALRVPRGAGLRASSAKVVTERATGPVDVNGRAFLTSSTVVLYEGRIRFTAAALVDAVRPGRRPAALPGQRSVQGRRGLVDAGGGISARRVGSRWLVVRGGDRAGRHRVLAALGLANNPIRTTRDGDAP